MTRKRFVKLLMSAGYSRNEAVDYAATFLPRHGSYRGMYLKWLVDRENPEFSEALTRLFKAVVARALDAQLALASIDWNKTAAALPPFVIEAIGVRYTRIPEDARRPISKRNLPRQNNR